MKIFIEIGTMLMILATVLGLDENAVKDIKCVTTPRDDISLNWRWVYSVEKWYIPLLGKSKLYKLASDILNKDVIDISQAEIANPCIVCGNKFVFSGFGQFGYRYFIEVEDDGVLSFKPNRIGGLKSKFYVPLTDNETYILGISCYEDGQATWSLMSTKPKISSTIKKTILTKVKSLGFNLKFNVEVNYDSCGVRRERDEL